MTTNSLCTVVRAVEGKYAVIGAYHCMWQETDAYSMKKYGAANAGATAVYIPDISADVVKGDYITKNGYIEENGVSGMLRTVSVSRHCYGSQCMHHVEIMAK